MTPHRLLLALAHLILFLHHYTLGLYFQLVKWAHRVESKSERFERISQSELIVNWYEE